MPSSATSPARALSLFRRILRAARQWQNVEDKHYIRQEADKLFRERRCTSDPLVIDQQIFEGESRLEIALHYHIPYPRLHHEPLAPSKHRDAPSLEHSALDAIASRSGTSDKLAAAIAKRRKH